MINRKEIAGFEIVLMIVSMFAFVYSVDISEDSFEEMKELHEELINEETGGAVEEERRPVLEVIIEGFLRKMKEPMIPVVSANLIVPTVCCEYSNEYTDNNGELVVAISFLEKAFPSYYEILLVIVNHLVPLLFYSHRRQLLLPSCQDR